ncbi:DUF6506 family protein [Psychromonas sp. Urea-02u-13]|uniref:DUF6506 family protein n=1 Tax=Psychromonas sp. Urea-02u-13 TaxID=2058326 RepID=UPI000C31FE2C|nr:DUF6506 family protein [Psychromonas sp. Urea-02u-13]PKG37237.1 hypothetical protein CXF74_19890 [Psychromonas sp. Urea-02u-13]
MTVFKAAFIFIAPEAIPETNYSWVKTAEVEVKTLAVSSYKQACEQVKLLIDEGVTAIELCAGFGNQGVAEITIAAQGKAAIGVVRFDNHPCLDNVSGDSLFIT